MLSLRIVNLLFHKIETGIPQGTILGCILFSLYFNSLPENCLEVNLRMYADDTIMPGKSSVVVRKITAYRKYQHG